MRYVCALITVEDVATSRIFYENILGQKVSDDYGENVAFEGGFAIHKKAHFEKLIDRAVVPGANNFELYFEEDDLAPIENRLIGSGTEFIHRIIEQPWKQRVMRFYDPDRNIVEIGESMDFLVRRLSLEQFSAQEISRITYIEPDRVKAMLAEKNS